MDGPSSARIKAERTSVMTMAAFGYVAVPYWFPTTYLVPGVGVGTTYYPFYYPYWY